MALFICESIFTNLKLVINVNREQILVIPTVLKRLDTIEICTINYYKNI